MTAPASRQEFIDYCLRHLGQGALTINVTDEQIDDRVDEALQYFREFHYDGTEEMVMKYQITDTDLANRYIPIPDNVLGITKILPLAGVNMSSNLFNIQYQMMITAIPDFTNAGLAQFYQSMQYLDMMNIILNGEVLIRFNRNTNKLYLDYDWISKARAGDWIVIVGYSIVDPDAYTETYNDRMFKKLATAHIKYQWGVNMGIKFTGMQLPGGIQLSGYQMMQDALKEIEDVEQQIRDTYEVPPMFIMA